MHNVHSTKQTEQLCNIHTQHLLSDIGNTCRTDSPAISRVVLVESSHARVTAFACDTRVQCNAHTLAGQRVTGCALYSRPAAAGTLQTSSAILIRIDKVTF